MSRHLRIVACVGAVLSAIALGALVLKLVGVGVVWSGSFRGQHVYAELAAGHALVGWGPWMPEEAWMQTHWWPRVFRLGMEEWKWWDFNGGAARIDVPAWVVLLIAGPATLWARGRMRSRERSGNCPHCRYDLTGLPARGRCPECGTRR